MSHDHSRRPHGGHGRGEVPGHDVLPLVRGDVGDVFSQGLGSHAVGHSIQSSQRAPRVLKGGFQVVETGGVEGDHRGTERFGERREVLAVAGGDDQAGARCCQPLTDGTAQVPGGAQDEVYGTTFLVRTQPLLLPLGYGPPLYPLGGPAGHGTPGLAPGQSGELGSPQPA